MTQVTKTQIQTGEMENTKSGNGDFWKRRIEALVSSQIRATSPDKTVTPSATYVIDAMP